MMSFDQQRVKLLALPKAAANGERAQCYAMIALTARDQMATLWLAQFNKILPSYLERRLDTLRATAHKEYVAKPERRMGNEVVCQIFRSLRGKEARMRVFEIFKLRAHRGDDVGMRVAEARHGGTAGSVDIALTGLVVYADVFARNCDRVAVNNGPMQDVRHLLRPYARANDFRRPTRLRRDNVICEPFGGLTPPRHRACKTNQGWSRRRDPEHVPMRSNHLSRVMPVPDLIRGLSRASTSFLRR